MRRILDTLTTLALAALATLAPSLAELTPARAEPAVVKPGKLVLPLSGLQIELPKDKRKGHSWLLSASYSFDDSYDARDVLDEKIDGKLVSGTWVLVGYFTAGDCKAVVASADLTDTWTSEKDLFGSRWQLRGGTYDFESDLGKVPAIAMCADPQAPATPDDRKSLLVYHFFVDQPLGTPQDALLAALAKKPLLDRVAKSWREDRFSEGQPLRRPEVRNRGKVPANRTVTLGASGFVLDLPDDGYGWLPRPREPGSEEPVDWFDRMAPAEPELVFELARVPDSSCEVVFEGITTPRAKGQRTNHVPEGWMVGPVLDVEGDPEHTICRVIRGAAIVVGMFNDPHTGPAAGDFTPLHPMLEAIANAASK